MLRAHSKHADELSSLASKINVLDEAIGVGIVNKTLRVTIADLISTNPMGEHD